MAGQEGSMGGWMAGGKGGGLCCQEAHRWDTHSHRHTVTHHLALRVTGWIRPPSSISFSDTHTHTPPSRF